MSETVGTPEEIQLQLRADAIIHSLERAFEAGLDPRDIRDIENDYPRLHRDMLQVYLGLKPAATHLEPILAPYIPSPSRDFLTFFPSEIPLLYDPRGAIWNPDAISTLLTQHSSVAMNASVESDEDIKYWEIDPNHPFFGEILTAAALPDQPESVTELAGIITGIPANAAYYFSIYSSQIIPYGVELWEKSETPRTQPPSSMRELIIDKAKREQYLRRARQDGLFQKDRDFYYYLRNMRFAEVPGTPFITFGSITAKDEERMRSQYNASGMDEKLSMLLAKTLGNTN